MKKDIASTKTVLGPGSVLATNNCEPVGHIHITEFGLGDIVYLKTDEEQQARMITQITIKGNRAVTYTLSFGTEESDHFDMELSRDIDILKKTL